MTELINTRLFDICIVGLITNPHIRVLLFPRLMDEKPMFTYVILTSISLIDEPFTAGRRRTLTPILMRTEVQRMTVAAVEEVQPIRQYTTTTTAFDTRPNQALRTILKMSVAELVAVVITWVAR